MKNFMISTMALATIFICETHTPLKATLTEAVAPALSTNQILLVRGGGGGGIGARGGARDEHMGARGEIGAHRENMGIHAQNIEERGQNIEERRQNIEERGQNVIGRRGLNYWGYPLGNAYVGGICQDQYGNTVPCVVN
jgi:hypothetical protein